MDKIEREIQLQARFFVSEAKRMWGEGWDLLRADERTRGVSHEFMLFLESVEPSVWQEIFGKSSQLDIIKRMIRAIHTEMSA